MGLDGGGDLGGEQRGQKETAGGRKSGICEEEKQEDGRNQEKRTTISDGAAEKPINPAYRSSAVL